MRALALLAIATATPALAASPEQVVQAQVEAFNAGNVDDFLSAYSDTAVLYDHPGNVWLNGKAAMRADYAKQFAEPRRTTVLISKRIVSGDYVVDEEAMMGGTRELGRGVAIYHVANGKIDRVDFLPPVQTKAAK